MANGSTLRTLAEFIGGMSIVVSLIFVGLELRHANNVAEVDSVLQINAMYVEALTAAHHDPETVQMIAENNNRELSAVRGGYRNLALINIAEAAWTSFDRGIMEEAHYLSYVQDVCQYVFPNGLEEPVPIPDQDIPWEQLKLTFNPEFAEVVESRC